MRRSPLKPNRCGNGMRQARICGQALLLPLRMKQSSSESSTANYGTEALCDALATYPILKQFGMGTLVFRTQMHRQALRHKQFCYLRPRTTAAH